MRLELFAEEVPVPGKPGWFTVGKKHARLYGVPIPWWLAKRLRRFV